MSSGGLRRAVVVESVAQSCRWALLTDGSGAGNLRYLDCDPIPPKGAPSDGPKAFPAAPGVGDRDLTLSLAVQLYLGV